MQEKLIIFIHADDMHHPSWVVLNDAFHVGEAIQHGEPLNLSSLAIGKKVMVIVPAQDVLLTTVNLPKMNKSKLLQALPFALEDQVISEIDTLHFVPKEQKMIPPLDALEPKMGRGEGPEKMIPTALAARGERGRGEGIEKVIPSPGAKQGERGRGEVEMIPSPGAKRGERGRGEGPPSDTTLAVAVIAKEKMQTFLELLKFWAVQPDVLMPLTFALPVTEYSWHILNDVTVVVRTGNYHGFVVDKNNLNEIINIALASSEVPPQFLYIHQFSSDNVALQLNSNIEMKMNIDIKIDSYSIERLAENACKYPIINLLQGFYKNKKSKFRETRKIQKATLWLIATWLVLLFLYPIVSYFLLYQKANDLNDQIKKIYRQHFPNATNIVAPKIRMEDKLKKVVSHNENRFFILLKNLGLAMTNEPGIKLKRLDFQNDQLTLELTALSSENFAGFIEFLIKQGAQVKQQSANVIGDKMNAIIAVK